MVLRKEKKLPGLGLTFCQMNQIGNTILLILNMTYLICFFIGSEYNPLDIYFGGISFAVSAVAIGAHVQLFYQFEFFAMALNSFLLLDRKIRKGLNSRLYRYALI